jgi:anti-sigma factor RsiW
MTDNISTALACQELVEIVTDYLDGTLPEHDRARFDAHIMTCPGCREYVEQMRITIRTAGRLTVESISPGARGQLLEAFRRMKTSSTGL